MANCGWPAAGVGMVAFRHADLRPRFLIEIGVEAGQDHRAVRQPRDGCDQLGGRRHRAGGARGNHRTVRLCGEPRGFGFNQPVAALGGFDGVALRENFGPLFTRYLQEAQRLLPELVEVVPEPDRPACPTTPGASSCRPSAARGRRRAPSADAGLLTTAAAGRRHRAAISAHLRTSCASNARRSNPSSAGGRSSASALPALAKMISSASTSPMARMRGSITASAGSTSRKASRARRQARRVGR